MRSVEVMRLIKMITKSEIQASQIQALIGTKSSPIAKMCQIQTVNQIHLSVKSVGCAKVKRKIHVKARSNGIIVNIGLRIIRFKIITKPQRRFQKHDGCPNAHALPEP